eukprot:TRINITY_DN25489_c0_g1_i1.p1 TRINITY_DN25489_c0_g1~~TRINITY_DN25489_c0_g1_i1.p1  ORF type:complete len:316 (-),score=91.67 TRINITY_DN25489_c0_g1_i1:418-1338(-)
MSMPGDISETSGRWSWLAAEGAKAEEKAAELDSQGQSAQAALFHLRAASKFKEAAELCPEQSDRTALEEHAADISARAIYLESLGGMPPSLPLEDHVGDLTLSLDLSAAEAPQGEEVSGLLARSGVTGSSAELSDEGFQIVSALKNQDEMQTFLRRLLAADWRQVRADDASELEFVAFVQNLANAGEPCSGLCASIKEQLRKFSWVELNLGPEQDRLQVAVAMEKEARDLEAAGKAAQAIETLRQSVAVFELVYKFDPRSKNPKIKDMVGSRIEELGKLADRLESETGGAGLGDDLEARLRKLHEG